MKNISPIEIADCYLGNIKEDETLTAELVQSRQAQQYLEVMIERKDRRKGRIFTQAASGQPIGIVKSRDWQLRDGDMLRTQSDWLVLVRLKKQQLIALQFDKDARNSPVQLVKLGHAIGNHHWPVTLRGEILYVELSDDSDAVESTINKIIESLEIEGLQVACELASADNTLDFSSAAALPHFHSHSHEH
ncbi:MAG: urease accessory protein UreE [Cyanobacteria bacterium P01_D01_bin.1]